MYNIFLTGKRPLLTKLRASLLLASLVWAPCSGLAATANWQWKDNGGRERIVIQLDSVPNTASTQIKRTGLNTVQISGMTEAPNIALQGAAPALRNLVGTLQPSPDGLVLELTNSAFGYVASQPSPGQIVIDVFPDLLGARWQANGRLAPVGTAPKAFTPTSRPVAAPVVSAPTVPASVAKPIVTPVVTPEEKQSPVITPTASAPAQIAASQEQTPIAPPQPVPLVKSRVEELEPAAGIPASAQESETPQAETVSPIPSPSERVKENASASQNLSLVSEAQAATNAVTGSVTPAPTAVAAEKATAKPTEENVSAQNSEPLTPPTVSSPAEPTQRGTVLNPQQIQAPINMSGPEYWPEDTGISTTLSPNAAPTAPETPTGEKASEQATTEKSTPSGVNGQQDMELVQSVDPAQKPAPSQEEVAEPRPVIYQDEEGNVVPKPPVLEEVYAEATRLMDEAKYKEALPVIEQLLTLPKLSPEMREQALYYRSDAVNAIYTGKPLEGYEDIITSTNEAMNANLRSSRVPDALYRLGMANLNVGNLAEAEGYFKALKRRYPYDNNVPVAFHSLGRAQMKKELFAPAEKIFRDILQEYPDSPAVKDATISLVQALTGLKNYEEALIYADFADKRWARYYIESPEYLLTLADIDYNLGKKEAALQKYWLLYNLLPTAENAPDVLALIGDLYYELQLSEPAAEVFSDIVKTFPDSDAAALAVLRLAEKGIHDSPISMPEMFAVFDNPGNPLPQVVYQELVKERPEDARSSTAQLKYALWQLWDKQYVEAMGTAADFIDLHPENADVELARDTIMRGFMADLKNSLLEENYGRVLTLWNGFPIVRERYGEIDPDLRNALARGYLERGEDEKAMELFAEFLTTPKHPQYSDPTFALYFNKYLENGNWNAMLDLGEIVKDWDMSPAMRGQLDYAMALSAENLGLRERSLDLWIALADNMDIPKYQRAYATYFLAKDAEERKDIKDAYTYNLKTLQLFDELKQERSDRADEGRRKEAMGSLMDITEVANRIPESLEWVERYNQFVEDTSPEYPGLRFREARLYRKLGNAEKAKQLLEIIANGYKDSPFAAAAATELATFEVSRDLQNFIPKNQ